MLGPVRLMTMRTFQRLASDTHEQNVFLKLHPETSIQKARSEGLVHVTSGVGPPTVNVGHRQPQASPRKGHGKFPADKQIQSFGVFF